MSAWIAQMTEAVILGICKALAKPGVLLGLINAWRQANEPQQIIASKPNQNDTDFIRTAQVDGWAASSPLPHRNAGLQ